MINDNVKGHASIGRIDVLPNFSFFEVEEKSARNIIGSLKNINFFGKTGFCRTGRQKRKLRETEHSGRKGDSVKRDFGGKSSQKRESLETNTNLPKVGDVKTVRKNGDNKNPVIKKIRINRKSENGFTVFLYYPTLKIYILPNIIL